ncbi:hypothetical protein PFNF135_05470, partial [Plasmodium falciparum NF135/5.C10]
MCDRNLEEIKPHQITSTHNLLLDVLLAAKHEGEMITKNLKEYDNANYESKICTALARSFADIGDIVRGKDLFLGHKQRKINLENRLQTMFANILNDNTKELGKLTTEQLREYWWALNRDQVWKAITCKAKEGDIYSKTANGIISFDFKCGHDNDKVTTNLDYVPQHLRWFQEWAEDFCRKKNKKLKDAIQKCRGEGGNDKYCDLNGYDCEKTKRGRNIYRWDYKCTGCFLSCSHFRTWIDNQKEQFLKQRNKYQTEISVGGSTSRSGNGGDRRSTTRQRRSAHGGSYDNGYEKIFYEQLKNDGYGTVNDFLGLLNNEKACKEVKDSEGGKIDFKQVNSGKNSDGDGSNKTFSHTEYCQACPLCG